jgi:hypothetical protein
MAFSASVQASTWGRPILLGSSWVCAAWFMVAMLLFSYGGPVPPLLGIAAYLSGAIALFGAVIAVVYLALGIWLRIRWLLGFGALLLNAGFFAFFWHSLP